MFEPHELASMLFEETGPIWLAYHRRHIHERTAFDYLKWIKCLDWFFHGTLLSEITLTHLEQYQTLRAAGELGPKKRQAGPVRVNHELGVLCPSLGRSEHRFQPKTVGDGRAEMRYIARVRQGSGQQLHVVRGQFLRYLLLGISALHQAIPGPPSQVIELKRSAI